VLPALGVDAPPAPPALHRAGLDGVWPRPIACRPRLAAHRTPRASTSSRPTTISSVAPRRDEQV